MSFVDMQAQRCGEVYSKAADHRTEPALHAPRSLFVKELRDGVASKSDLIVLCGDLNCGPSSPAYGVLAGEFEDPNENGAPTWTKENPLTRSCFVWGHRDERIDHVLHTPGWDARAEAVLDAPPFTSDHLGVLLTVFARE